LPKICKKLLPGRFRPDICSILSFMKKLLLFIFIIPCLGHAQTQRQERTMLLYNIGFGGFSSGVGAVLNKPKGKDWKKYFLKGFWQGSIGGLLNYSGKKTLYLVNQKQQPAYAWPAKILHAAGNSIMENAALNEPFLQNWQIEIDPVRFDFSLRGKKPFRARFLPVTIYSVAAAARDSRLDLPTTLLTGNIAFKAKGDWIRVRRGYFTGMSFGRAFAYVNSAEKYEIIAHELVHQMQYREYQIANTWLIPYTHLLHSKKLEHIFHKYIYADVPYFLGFYVLEGFHDPFHYYRNFYELEAERFATNQYVPVH
jgi:hypothetical protein